jgi:hypothetical protein
MDRRTGQWQPRFAEVDPQSQIVGREVEVGSQGTWWAPSIVWTGSEYGIAWATYLEGIRFRRVDGSGSALAPEIRVTDRDDSAPSLVWTGAEDGLTGSRYPENRLVFSRLDSKGREIGSKLELDLEMLHSSPAWTGVSYGVAVGSTRDSIRLVGISCPGVGSGAPASGATGGAGLPGAARHRAGEGGLRRVRARSSR